jgi:hypothetical protein
MLTQYSIEYSPSFRKHHPAAHHIYYSDDPVACEEFIQELLEQGMALHAIRHEGAALSPAKFDRMVRLAAARLAAQRICTTLKIKPDEERHRFGFAN